MYVPSTKNRAGTESKWAKRSENSRAEFKRVVRFLRAHSLEERNTAKYVSDLKLKYKF
jgi:hypothetical protein